jgi:hypothetical protein
MINISLWVSVIVVFLHFEHLTLGVCLAKLEIRMVAWTPVSVIVVVRSQSGPAYPSQAHPRFRGVRVAHIYIFFSVVFLCFACLRPVSCFPHVVSVSGLFFLDFLLGFLLSCKT